MSQDELVQAYIHGDISRRVFIRRLTAVGVSLSAALAYAEMRPQQAHARRGDHPRDHYDHYDHYDHHPVHHGRH